MQQPYIVTRLFNTTHTFPRKSRFLRFLVSFSFGGFTLSKKRFLKEQLGVDVEKDGSNRGVDADACPDCTKSHLGTHLNPVRGWKGYGPIISRRLADVGGIMVGKAFSQAGAGASAFEGPCTFSFSLLHSKLLKDSVQTESKVNIKLHYIKKFALH